MRFFWGLFLLLFFIFFSITYANTTLGEINGIIKERSVVNSQQTINKNNKRNKRDKKNVYNLKNDYQFILFYRASCPHCQRFAPILKEYSQDSSIKVIAFTLDGVSLPSFPNSISVSRRILEEYFGDNKINKINEISVPTLFLSNKINFHAYPVSIGELSYYELTLRMNELVPEILSFERSQHV